MAKVYIASSCFNLREGVGRRPFKSCHQTPQPVVSTFQFSWFTEYVCIKLQISDIRKNLFHSLLNFDLVAALNLAASVICLFAVLRKLFQIIDPL